MTKIRKLLQEIDLRKNPWRGIVRELAEEEGVTKAAISRAVRVHRNPRIIARLLEKIEEREKIVREAEQRGIIDDY